MNYLFTRACMAFFLADTLDERLTEGLSYAPVPCFDAPAFAREIDPSGTRTRALRQDVTRSADAETVTRAATEAFGGIDHLVTGAGLYRDATIAGMSDALTDLNKTMSGMNGTLEYFEETLKMFNSTLTRIDELAPRLNAMVERMEGIVGRVERIVGMTEAVMSPLTATESAVRGVLNAVRRAGR